MSQKVVAVVERLLARAPQWIRHDLTASDPIVRQRAEEALAAMIGAALEELSAAPVDEVSAAGG